jgi:hypothetical protein
VPFVRLGIEQVKAAVVQVELRVPPELAENAEAVYPVIAAPPLDVGANQDTIAAVGLATTATCNGVVGTDAGVPDVADDALLVPIAFIARSFTE